MFEQRFSQAQSTSNPLLPDEQVLWEGKERKPYRGFGIFFLIQVVGIILVSFAVQTTGLLLLFLTIVLPTLVLVNFLLFLVFMRQNTKHYLLTSERLIIKSTGSRNLTVNANFSQMLNIELKSPDYNPYVKITSPFGEIPDSYRPANGVQQFHQKLYRLWQAYWQNASLDEKAQLEHFYNPPLRPWIKFRSIFLFTTVIPFIFLFIFTKITGIKVLTSVGVFAVSFIGMFVRMPLQILILGKEYKLNLRVSPRHARVTLALSLIFIALLFLMLIIFG